MSPVIITLSKSVHLTLVKASVEAFKVENGLQTLHFEEARGTLSH